MYIPGSLINPVGRQPVFNEFFPYYQSQTRTEGKKNDVWITQNAGLHFQECIYSVKQGKPTESNRWYCCTILASPISDHELFMKHPLHVQAHTRGNK